ncbi:MAG: DNA-directed RNA polymerase subunit L [Candidatus Woesearchaeota archaeon]|nr:DNA-directed RNA polymerase subunit L [Candidatus Woesearchaeota archaeon]
MELVVVEETKTRLIFDLKGEDHTFCNLLKEELHNDKDIKAATYAIAHPLIGVPQFTIDTSSGKTPRKAVIEALGRMKKTFASFKKAVDKELK